MLRAGFGRYFLNPTGQGFNNGFSISTPFISSANGGRVPLYNLGNPFPNGVLQPTGSELGPLTFLGRGPGYASIDFEVPNVDHVSFGIQREFPWRASLEISYAASRTHGQQTSFGAINEPSLDLVRSCDVTRGGNRQICDQLLPNPFFGVPGFEGTTRFTNATLSRFEQSRPFPAFTGIAETGRNDGKLTYDSLQVVGNKRWSKGLSLNTTWTYVPRWEEVGGFIDNITREQSVGPYFAHRKHRITASGVWEIPGRGLGGVLGEVLGGWSMAPAVIFQSGQPWDLPGNVELVGDASLPVRKTGQFIYGVSHRKGAVPGSARGVQRVQQRLYDERQYNGTTTSADFGRIN